MKKRYLLNASLLVLCWMCWNVVYGNPNMPDNPYAPEFILASHATSSETPGNPLPAFEWTVQDTIPLEDRYGDFMNEGNQNPFDLKDPPAIEQEVEFDPETGQYIITEKIGEDYFRPPTYMTFDEYLDYKAQQQEQSYFNQLSGLADNGISGGKRNPLAKVDIGDQMIERLFGGTEVDINPQGNIDLTFGVELSNIQNPSFTQRQQRQGGFDFDMAIQMNVEGSIGKKLRLSTNYNTQATFDFDNTMKLDYNTDAFGEDDIIKQIEAGNVSLPLQGSLIQGSQSLFGIKTELQFGRLRLNLVASQQKSEREDITIQGGSQFQEFEVFIDEYDENRHFFLTHYNRNNFEEALAEIPQIKTLFTIERIQVWVTDTRNATENIRDVVALADLGETTRFTNPDQQPPFVATYTDLQGEPLPDNNANDIYQQIVSDPQARETNRVVNFLRNNLMLQQGRDFEKVSARQLSPTEFTFHPNLGFVSLNVNIQPDQVVGVAFEYSYGDSVYQVGQIAEDIEQNRDTVTQNVLFLKMLKSTIQPVDLPTWDLMMKNIYNIGAYNVSREDFKLGVFYEDPGEGRKQFMPAEGISDIPLLRIFNLDRLNVQNDPQPDGVFDFVEGLTINTRNGRIMFPVLEPFGSSLAKRLTPQDSARFVYNQLYDETLFNAREYQRYNRFTIAGTYKSSVSSEISLGAFNIPPGSVTVTAGGQILREGQDYEVDYNIGRVRILNDAILNAGAPIKVSFEDNALFGFQTKTMLGMRADYTVNKNLTIGGTYLHLFERPFTQKVNIGDDPINNRIFGLDMNYSNEAPWLTKLVDKLPLISTKEPSSITFAAETAALKPGHARAINEETASERDKGGVVYIDDFEGSAPPLDLRQPFIGTNGWVISSVPQDDPNATDPLFPEALERENTLAGVNRALINWYRLDPGAGGSENDRSNPYAQTINQQEIFPNFTPQTSFGQTFSQILDVVYDPTERGPYNFDSPDGTQYSAGLNSDGKLEAPETRWGGIMRSMNTNDFQSTNIEFVEFWVMSPYLDTTGAIGFNQEAFDGGMNGEIVLNFGNISEDIMPDSRKFFENGLPGPNTQGRRATFTPWGRVPLTQQITNAFDIEPENRAAQDVGLDGLDDQGEEEFFSDYLASLQGRVSPAVLTRIESDPSNDNFRHFREYPSGTSVSTRYSRFYGTQGNTPQNTGETFVVSSTQLPDAEDLDGDRTVNETENYFEYRIPVDFDPNANGGVGGLNVQENPFITEFIVSEDDRRVWYRFRVPLDLPDSDPNFRRVGSIRDFRSIRFMRMYFKDFSKKVHFRFATFELIRNQWRRYRQQLVEDNLACPALDINAETQFEVNAVNIEENSQRQPFGYTLPPGITREQALGVNLNALQNEQALSLRVCELQDGDAKGIFKNVNLDMRVFEKLKMFIHGEETICGAGIDQLEDGDLSVFVRLGSDFQDNYYEYEIPLTISDENSGIPPNDPDYQRVVWPSENDITIDFDLLTDLKEVRNKDGFPLNRIFAPGDDFLDPDKPEARFRIKGNPNLGLVKAVMVGVRNPKENVGCAGDDHSVEIWVNELRLFGLDERGGVAATARLDMQMADFGNLTLSGKVSSIGFGALDQQLAERSREQVVNYDIAGNFELSKFLPSSTGIRLPFYFQYSNETSTPQFDPYDLDVEVKDKLNDPDRSQFEKDSIKNVVQTVTTIKSYNFTNVRKERTNPDKKPMPWDLANFSFTYAFDETTKRDPFIEEDVLTRRRGAIDYSYSRDVKYIEPLKKVIKSKQLKFLSNMNLNPLPNSFGFSTDLDRRFNRTKYRFAGENPLYNTYYNKQFLWNRNYDLQWDLTRNIKIQFNADNTGVIDEPEETLMLRRSQLDEDDPDYIADIGQYRRDSIWAGIRDFGRTKRYQHNINVSYIVPLKDFPMLSWVGVKASYRASYGWDAASQSAGALSLGNVIRNGQTRQVNADLDFEKLYNYSPYLKKINSRPRGGRRSGAGSGRSGGRDPGGVSGDKDKKTRKERRQEKREARKNKDKDAKGQGNNPTQKARDKDKNRDRQPSQIERAIIRPLMMVRKVRLNYQEDFGTVVPGYLPESKLLGMSNFESPGWGFIAGWQPNIRQDDYYSDNDWLYKNWDWITGDQLLNQPVTQSYTQKIDGKITIEPFQDFRIDVEGGRQWTENHSEYFRRNVIFDENNPDNRFQEEMEHLIPKDFGSFSVSYMAINTLFNDDLTGLFNRFDDNRVIIANRLGTGVHGEEDDANLGFPEGYGRSQQNVLLPAFIAAYTDQDANNIEVSDNYIGDVVLKTIPRPNWRLTYNGLNKLEPFKEIFQSFSLSHSYKGTLTVNSYTTDLQFDPEDPNKLREEDLDFYARYQVPDVQIQEQFSPLIGVDMRLKNDMSFKVEYGTSRTLDMDLGEKQLRETKGTDITIGFGYKLKEVDLGLLPGSKKNKKKKKDQNNRPGSRPGSNRGGANQGDLDITFDFSIRDDESNLYILESDQQEPFRGNRTISILPQATYQLNSQLSLRLFFDYRRNVPKTSQGYPTTNIRSGITVRFQL